MKKFIGLCFLAVLCMGCTAQMMETHGQTLHVFTPANEMQGRGGVVRYLNRGLESWKKARRRDAEKQMSHYCGGTYRIIEEGPRSKFGASMPIGNNVSVEVDQYWYIRFQCEKPAG